MTDDVSDEQLLLDIRYTFQEMNSYEKIYIGHKGLSELPENREIDKDIQTFAYNAYKLRYDDCSLLLSKLVKIAKERKINLLEKFTINEYGWTIK